MNDERLDECGSVQISVKRISQMNTQSNAFEQCPHWRRGDSQDGPWCSLLKQVTTVEEPGLCRVAEDVCRSCCQSFPPSAQHINPVVASLVYRLTSEISTMLSFATELRTKTLVHFLASSAIRIGALESLKMKHVTQIEDCKSIIVYDGTTEEYVTFLMPEASSIFDDYIQKRESG